MPNKTRCNISREVDNCKAMKNGFIHEKENILESVFKRIRSC